MSSKNQIFLSFSILNFLKNKKFSIFDTKLNTLNPTKSYNVKNHDDRYLGCNNWWRNRIFLSLWGLGRFDEIKYSSMSLIEISNLAKEWQKFQMKLSISLNVKN